MLQQHISTVSAAAARKPRRVLVTGGCGFVGSVLAHWLLSSDNPAVEGCCVEVTVLDKLTHGSCPDNIGALAEMGKPRFSFVEGDFGDEALVEALLRERDIDCVMHLGGETHVDRSFADPEACLRNNAEGTWKLLQACRRVPSLRVFLMMSTDEIYGDEREAASAETDTPRPTNPYAASKVAAEALATVARSAYGLPVVTVRCNNIYGPMQTDDKVVPRFLALLADGSELQLHGGGAQTRTWVHVQDVCAALWAVACRGTLGGVYNIGSAHEISVAELARRLYHASRRTGLDVPPLRVREAADRPHNDRHYRIDWRKIRDELGWTPRIDFDAGLRATALWYHASRESGLSKTPGFVFQQATIVEHGGPSEADATIVERSGPSEAEATIMERGGPASRGAKVLLFGARGWIGGKLAAIMRARGIEVVEALSRPGDHPDAAVRREMEAVAPTHVLCSVGRTHGPGVDTIDYLEGGPDKLLLNARDNLYAPVMLAHLCMERGIRLTRVGTGCIFDRPGGVPRPGHHGDETGYLEDDDPDYFLSSYSVVQGITDRQLRFLRASVLNARFRMPVDADLSPRNFVTKIASYERVIDVPNAVTVLPDLLPWLVELMLGGVTGGLNFVNAGSISHNQVLALYRELVDPSFRVQNFSVEEQRRVLKAGRCNCTLDTTRLAALIERHGGRLKTAEEAVRECIATMAHDSEAVRAFVREIADARKRPSVGTTEGTTVPGPTVSVPAPVPGPTVVTTVVTTAVPTAVPAVASGSAH